MKAVLAVVLCVAAFAGVALGAEAKGTIELPNKKGMVLLDHEKHKELAQWNCKVCHDRPSEISGFNKAVAHRLCIGCHEPEAGKMPGPITCDGCHARQ